MSEPRSVKGLSWRALTLASVVLSLVSGLVVIGGPADAAVFTPRADVLRYKDLWHPLNTMASDGTDVWSTTSDGLVIESKASDLSLVRRITLSSGMGEIALSPGRVWVNSYASKQLIEIDATTGDILGELTFDDRPTSLASDGQHIWVGSNVGDSVTEVDASAGTVVRTIALGFHVGDMSADGRHVWAPGTAGLTELDASDGSVVRVISLSDGDYPQSASSDGDSVWITDSGGHVFEIRASDGVVVRSVRGTNDAQQVVADGGDIWLKVPAGTESGYHNDVRVLRASDLSYVSSFHVPEMSWGQLVTDGTSVWTVGTYNGHLVQMATQPDAPVITSVTSGDGAVLLSWNEHGAAITTRTVRAYSGDSLEMTTTACTRSPCRVTGLNNGMSYTFTVSDTNGIGEGPQSAPSDPTIPSAAPNTPEPWAEAVSDGAQVAWSPPFDNGAPITGYVFSTSSDLVQWTTTRLPASTTSVVIPLAAASARYAKVAAVNATGTSSFSAPVVAASGGTQAQDVTVLTHDGQPVVGGAVSWAMDPRTAWSSKSYGLLNDGSIGFPSAPAGVVVVTLADVVLPNGLLASGELRGVLGMGRLVLRLPEAPAAGVTTVHVQTPSGQPLSGATVSVAGVTDTTTAGGITFGVTDAHRTGLTDLGGDFQASGFSSDGAEATVSFDDGVITQQRVAALTSPTTSVTMPYEPELMPTVTQAEARSGDAVSETLRVTAAQGQSSARRAGSSSSLAGIAVRAHLPKGSSVGACGAVLSAVTNAKGKAKLRICATTTSTIGFSATGAYVVGALRLFVKGAAPTAVTDLHASTPSTGCLKVGWSPPEYTGGQPVTSYSVNVTAQGQPTVSLTTTKTSIKVKGLANATRYRVWVAARTSKGAGPGASITAPVA